MELIIIGVCTFFNIAIIKWKYDRGQKKNAFLDATLLGGVMFVFSGSLGALQIGTVASALVSLYLIASPLKEAR